MTGGDTGGCRLTPTFLRIVPSWPAERFCTGNPLLNRGWREIREPTMRFQANYVSISVSGDYYQALFEAEEDATDPDSPYLLIQRQFEMPDGGRCYIETHDEKYIGHFRLRRVEFTPERLSIEFDRPRDNIVSVTFSTAVPNFEEASQVVRIISGEIKSQ